MTFWREFFSLNHTILLFIYGQVFFVLGLAILWQSRHHSRLNLARSLGWLGAFGLAHGLHEWGDIFIPVQAEYLSQTWVAMLLVMQVCLLAFSFAALLQFGVEMLRPLYPRLQGLVVAPALLLVLWLTGFVWRSQVASQPAAELVTEANVWARYVLGFPGALVAALGLRQQTRRQLQNRAFARPAAAFQTASATLVAYALLGGLIVPPAPFFPANFLNTQTFTHLLGMPPLVLRSLAGLVLVLSIVRGLEIFEMEIDRRIEEMEQAQILQAERERVSRELHDGAIQTVYTAGLMAEAMRRKVDDNSPLALRLDRVIAALQHAIRDLRQFVVQLEPDTAHEGLVEGLRKLTEESQLGSLVELEVNLQGLEAGTFPPARAAHVLAIVNEALSNIARHARARHVQVSARRQNGQLLVSVTDDGCGFSEEAGAGFGLRNMRDRARLLGGALRIEKHEPQGTRVLLSIPWNEPS